MIGKFGRGSEWNKWDLHVHTPKSIIQHYGGDTPEAWDKYIADLESLPEEIKVLGINDYIFLDGYKVVKRRKEEGRLKNIDLILPVVELRVNRFGNLSADDGWKRVNLHVIFSNELSTEEIEEQFLNAIQHTKKLSPDTEGVNFVGVASKANLEKLGIEIKAAAPQGRINGTSLEIGFNNINYDYDIVYSIVDGYFKGKCLTAVGKSEWEALRWVGSAAEKKNIINNASFTFVSLENPRVYKNHCKKFDEVGVRNFLLDCSDAHSFSKEKKMKDRIGNSFTWLKADLTFEGLKQVANDRSRIFVGETPPLLQRTVTNPTKFIESLEIKKVGGTTFSEKWFENFNLTLNPSLVAIIGNKGQGKSAIADIIGLLGNTPNYEDFSFLNDKKFRKRKPIRKSDFFSGRLTWMDKSSDEERILTDNPDQFSVEKVKYLPQDFIESLCNNEDSMEFETELRKVIFSHITYSDKLGKNNLDDLLEFQSEIIMSDIEEVKSKIQITNKKIIDLEKKKSASYRKGVEEQLKEMKNELVAHEALKPTPVEVPSDPETAEKNKLDLERISVIRRDLEDLENKIGIAHKFLSTTKFEIAQLEKTIQIIDSLVKQVEEVKSEIKPIFDTYSLDLDLGVSLKIDKSGIEKVLIEKRLRSAEINYSLSNEDQNGFLERKADLTVELKGIQAKLDEQSQSYQRYLDSIKEWKEKQKLIIGEEGKEESISGLENHLKYLDEKISLDLTVAKTEREKQVTILFERKEEVIKLYERLFKPVESFIESYGELLSEYKIQLDVDFRISGLSEKFFDHVSLGSKGSFIGNPSGYEKLNQILEKHDLKTAGGVISFLDDVILHLQNDLREGQNNEEKEIETQLKKGYTTLDLYTYLFNLDYLIPEYKLKLGSKNLTELSPGERGALLLIFYLTLDQGDIPLVIDQPEENLDNQSVFKILVQFIKKAKERRQIIIVTHNPNLAVACHAEQIVHIEMDKENGNQVRFTSGSLENPMINNSVIKILEGTYPALTTRTNTYGIILRTSKEMSE
ncbi:TrlF family AAA-like ATPase [Pleomorphovibrio marinus]|uniref:TrlF family AAA-like ATPase n=1 Tax=Pleomorphovibrio marinus TaxID=2164132 RepID=UPI000E0B3D81|nr:AAA family ATPase [Pleomorphovibrio marinus]